MSPIILINQHDKGSKMKKSLKTGLSIYTMLALITSCTSNLPNITSPLPTSNVDIINSTNKIISRFAIRGKAEFPALTHPPALECRN